MSEHTVLGFDSPAGQMWPALVMVTRYLTSRATHPFSFWGEINYRIPDMEKTIVIVTTDFESSTS